VKSNIDAHQLQFLDFTITKGNPEPLSGAGFQLANQPVGFFHPRGAETNSALEIFTSPQNLRTRQYLDGIF
jgi:hypothetical protein